MTQCVYNPSCSASPWYGNQYSISQLGCHEKGTALAVLLNDFLFTIRHAAHLLGFATKFSVNYVGCEGKKIPSE
jgi:hypothetical protein